MLDITISVSERYPKYDTMEGVIGRSNYSFSFPAQLIVVLETCLGGKLCDASPMKTHVNRMEDRAPKWLTFFHHTNLRSVFSPQSEWIY